MKKKVLSLIGIFAVVILLIEAGQDLAGHEYSGDIKKLCK